MELEKRGVEVRKRELSAPRRRMLEIMRNLQYGNIYELRIQGGDPVLDPLPRMKRKIKLGHDLPRPGEDRQDFALKTKVVHFLNQLDELGDGIVERIEVQDGLPFRMTIPEVRA